MTTINTNNPFSDLYTHLTPQTVKPPVPQNHQTECNTTSSTQSIQNLLTSTFNESLPLQSSQPIMSPILKTPQNQLQTLQYSTDPHDIQQNLKLHEAIDDTLRTTYIQRTNHDITTSQSLPSHETSSYQPDRSIPQTDGNASETESLNGTSTPNTKTTSNRKKI